MAGLLTAPAGPDAVAVELRRWASEPFIWGESDCGLSQLAYIGRVTGRRLARPPRYSTRLGAVRMLRAAGGYQAYVAQAMAELGCLETDRPVRGDVGLVDLPVVGLSLCLCLGTHWAARGDQETVIAPMAPIAAWHIDGRAPCPRR